MITFADLMEQPEKKPYFGRSFHQFADHTDDCVEDVSEYCGHDDVAADGPEDADLVSSLLKPNGVLHAPVIDVDLPCSLVESSPGRFHLYIDQYVLWADYLNLLNALAQAGIVQPGYVEAAKRRKYTSVRVPWKQKAEQP